MKQKAKNKLKKRRKIERTEGKKERWKDGQNKVKKQKKPKKKTNPTTKQIT